MESNQPDQPPKSYAKLLAEKLWDLSKTGDFNSIGKIVKQLDIKQADTIAVLGWLCSEASTAQSATIIIEVLIQRMESIVLLKLGGIARLHGNNSISNRCLQAALDLGPLDELFEEVQSWPENSSSAEKQLKKEEYECMVVVQIAERGHSDAFYSAAVIPAPRARTAGGVLVAERRRKLARHRVPGSAPQTRSVPAGRWKV